MYASAAATRRELPRERMSVALILTDDRAAGDRSELSSVNFRVYNPVPSNDSILRIALACVGLSNPTIVRDRKTASVSYVTQPKAFDDDKPSRPLDAGINAQLLSALEPLAKITVGSLKHIFPDTLWYKDEGSAVMMFPASRVRVRSPTPSFAKPWRRNRMLPSRPTDAMRIPDSVPIDVHDIFTLGYTRISKRFRVASGLKLKDGDSFRDNDGVMWFFVAGRLQDRLKVTLPTKDFVIARDTITPRPSAKRPATFIAGLPFEVTLVDHSDPTKTTTYPCRSVSDHRVEWGWEIDKGASASEDAFVCVQADGTIVRGQDETRCRQSGGVWDRPCVRDDECPYNDPRRARGGCTKSGYCEFPLEAEAISYRRAAPSNRTLRHGCARNDPGFPECSYMPKSNARFAHRPTSSGSSYI